MFFARFVEGCNFFTVIIINTSGGDSNRKNKYSMKNFPLWVSEGDFFG